MRFKTLVITVLAIAALAPRFFAQGYAISQNLPGSAYLLLSLAVAAFSPFLFGLLCARVTDSLSRQPLGYGRTKRDFGFSVVLIYSYSICVITALIIFFNVAEIFLALIVGFATGIVNQMSTLQQAKFLKEKFIAELFIQQALVLLGALLVCLAVVWGNKNILIATMCVNIFLATCYVLLQRLKDPVSFFFVDPRRAVRLVKCSLFPVSYILATVMFLLYISIERFLADLFFTAEHKKYFFLINGYLVLATIGARFFRYTPLVKSSFAIAVCGLLSSILLVKGACSLYGPFPYCDEFVLIWFYPLAAVVSWRVFQEFREARLYRRALKFFLSLSVLKVVLLCAIGIVFHGRIVEIVSQFVYALIFGFTLWELRKPMGNKPRMSYQI